MNRRVLLIDSDPGFQGTLTRELSPYRVGVATEADADKAVALALADTPALIVLDIEEATKKAGFRVFEKCKKGALSKVPIILVTATVPPESFAKHRALKVHADEYIDKRGMTPQELIGKIDGLIALGEPEDSVVEELAIPVDDIPMELADGDVVLDEVIDSDVVDETGQPGDSRVAEAMIAHDSAAVEFGNPHDARTVGPRDGLSIDDVVEAETDAAFAALLGDDAGEPATPPRVAHAQEDAEPAGALDAALESVEHEPVSDAVPEPVPHVIPDLEPEPEPELETALAAHDDAVPEPLPGAHEHALPEEFEPDPTSDVGEIVRESVRAASQHEHARDAAAESDDDTDGLAAQPPRDVPPEVPTEIPHEHHSTPTAAASVEPPALVPYTAVPEHVDRLDSQPAMSLDEADLLALSDEHAVPLVPEPPVVAPRREKSQPQRARSGSGSHPAIDLGLDAVARHAESDQSGVHDRRTLRQVGELERQIAQLKAELERARASTDGGGRGTREAQFLTLRESMFAKEKELGQVKGDLIARDGELADARERLRQVQHAKSALESKNGELEQRLFDDNGRAAELAGTIKALTQQVAELRRELDGQTAARAAAEAVHAQAQRDLAAERALRESSAGEAERQLRSEREQLVARHHAELDSARAAAQTAQDRALAELRDQLAAANGAALGAALEESRRAHAAAHADAIAGLERTHAADIAALAADHAKTHGQLRAELEAATASHGGALAALTARYENDLAEREQEHAEAVAAQQQLRTAALAAQDQQHAAALAERDRMYAAQGQQHATAIAAHDQQHAAAIAERDQRYAAAIAERDRTYAAAQGDLSTRQRAQVDQLVAERDAALARAERDHAALVAERDAAVTRAERDHAALVAERDAALARAERDHAALVAEHAGERDALIAQHTGVLADAHAQHASALADAHAAHANDRAAAAAQHAGERDALIAQHAGALAERESRHATVLADAESRHQGALAEVHSARAAAEQRATQATAELAAAHEAAEQRAAQAGSDLRAELDRQAARHQLDLAAAEQQRAQLVAAHEEAQGALREQHQAALGDVAARHEQEVAKVHADRESIADAARRTAETHRAALAETEARHAAALGQLNDAAAREVAEAKATALAVKRAADDAAAKLAADRDADIAAHQQAYAELEAKHERAQSLANGEILKAKSVADAERNRLVAAHQAELDAARAELGSEHARALTDVTEEREELRRGLSSSRDALKRSEGELATAVKSIADRNAELRAHAAAIGERDARIAELRKEIEALETENTSYQEQVLRAYQKIKQDEAMVTRAKKAMAIALTVLDDQGNPRET